MRIIIHAKKKVAKIYLSFIRTQYFVKIHMIIITNIYHKLDVRWAITLYGSVHNELLVNPTHDLYTVVL